MKVVKIVILILVLLAAAAGIFHMVMQMRMYTGSRGGKRVSMSSVVSFEFGASGGSYMNSGVTFTAKKQEDGSVSVRVRLDGVPDEEADEFLTDTSFLQELDRMIEKYNVKKWNGFTRSNRMVMDGHGFRLSIKMDNGERLYATGYMAWPENYDEFSSEVGSLFMSLYEDETS